MSWGQRRCITSNRSEECKLIFFFSEPYKLLQRLSRTHGAKRETWVRGLPGPERSGDRVRHRRHRDTSQFHYNSCAAARLLCQRVALQAGKTGACKLWVVELWNQPQMKCWRGKNQHASRMSAWYIQKSLNGRYNWHSIICRKGSLPHVCLTENLSQWRFGKWQ